MTDFLRSKHLPARGIWELTVGLIQDNPKSFMLVDDSMQDKGYSWFVELVKHQYSGAEYGLVRGISIVNLMHYSAGDKKDFFPMRYHTYAPDQERKTKDEQFSEMVTNTVYTKNINTKRIWFDSWYASTKNLKLVRRLDLIFFTTQKITEWSEFEQRR